jgi:hypothetical protein
MPECEACKKLGCPTEGYTGQCDVCLKVFCFGHIGHANHEEILKSPSDVRPPNADEGSRLKARCNLCNQVSEMTRTDEGSWICNHCNGENPVTEGVDV